MIGVRTYITVFCWASLFVLQQHLPMRTIALAVLGFCVGAAVHAFVIRWGVRLFSRRCVRIEGLGERGARCLFWAGIVAAGAWYLVWAIHQGRGPLNIFAIESAYVAGVFLHERRDGVKRELRRRLAQLLVERPERLGPRG